MAVWLPAVLLGCLLGECWCFTLEVDSQHQQIQKQASRQFMCQANEPLAGCQVIRLNTNQFYDLSEGNRSVNYWGTGLENGQCGFIVRDTNVLYASYPYGCRARALKGGWEYATTVIHVTDISVKRVLVLLPSPRVVFADIGSDVTFVNTADLRLTSSSFTWPGQDLWIGSGSTNIYSIDTSKFEYGRYRLTLLNVTSNSSGIVTIRIRSDFDRSNIRLITLIVKMAPNAPALSLNMADGVYKEDDIMIASCHVGVARPVARITWLLDDDVIQGDAEDFTNSPWEFEAGGVTLNLSRKLSKADDGKELVCRVHHIALPGGVVDARSKIKIASVPVTSDFITGLFIGVGGSLALVTVVSIIAALLGWATFKGNRCCVRQGTTEKRESNLYVNTTELRSTPVQDCNVPVRDDLQVSNIYANIRHGNMGQEYDDQAVIYSN